MMMHAQSKQLQNRIEPLNEVIEGVLIGDHVASDNKYILSRSNITHILTIGAGLYLKFPQKFTYKWVSELDSPTTNLKQHFASCH